MDYLLVAITITATVAILIGLEIGWRLCFKEIKERLARKGYDTDKVLGE